ncbi:hypothetical protein [Streptomyces smyrnaeus]|uniref:hypothetical protein n=1 Tax=Streptomyces smyrnaeus TaxID=1387713 RepID=UPI0033E062A8
MTADRNPAFRVLAGPGLDRSISHFRLAQTSWRCALQVNVHLGAACALGVLLAAAHTQTPVAVAAALAGTAAAMLSGSVFSIVAFRQVSAP